MRNELVIRVQPNESVYCKVKDHKKKILFPSLLTFPLPTYNFTSSYLYIYLYTIASGDDQDPWDVIQPAGDRAGFDLQVQIQVFFLTTILCLFAFIPH